MSDGGARDEQASTAPSPKAMAPEAVQDIIAKVLDILPDGLALRLAAPISEAITAAIPVSTTCPTSQLEDDRKWSRRISHAHGKLRQWQMQHDDRREAQRKMSRQLAVASAHIAYWQSTLAAAQRKDPNWETSVQHAGIDSDHDRPDGDPVEDKTGSPTATTHRENVSLGTEPNGKESLQSTSGMVLMHRPNTTAGNAYPMIPSALMTTEPAPNADPLFLANERRMSTTKAQKPTSGYPYVLPAIVAKGGPTWESTQQDGPSTN